MKCVADTAASRQLAAEILARCNYWLGEIDNSEDKARIAMARVDLDPQQDRKSDLEFLRDVSRQALDETQPVQPNV